MSADGWVRSDSRAPLRPRLLPRRPLSLHTLALVIAVGLLGWIGWMWYRGSSLVKIDHVTFTGLGGSEVPQIRAALTRAALSMTTLNLQVSKLDAAARPYRDVRSLTVTTEGRHDLVIRVNEGVPVAFIQIGGQAVAVDGYGRLLPATTVPHGVLPTIMLASPPDGPRITAPGAVAVLQVLQAAPIRLLSRIQTATSSAAHGVTVQLRSGPQLYFGPATQLVAKWVAVLAVLQNSDSAGASYIDVSDPQRPAAGVSVSTTSTTATTSTSAGSAPDANDTTVDQTPG